MSTENSPSESAEKPPRLMKRKNLVVIGLLFAALWGLAISSGSFIFMGISGGITLLAAGLAYWAWRYVRRQQALASVIQKAGESPEARKAALAKLEADPKANDTVNLIARAQLLASESPSKAFALLEPIELKAVPANLQDDFALLKAQLLLNLGRAKQARPLVDWVNVDSAQRKEMRPLMVGIVAEAWARTSSAKEANELLDSVDFADEGSIQAKALLLSARVFAQFGAGKKGLTRSALQALAAEDPNLLGRFISPKSKVHPGLQRLAREASERNSTRRAQKGAHVAAGGRRR